MAKSNNNGNVTVVKTKSRRAADIVVFVVVGLAALILIAVAVLSAVRINPVDNVQEPESYNLYAPGSSDVIATNSEAQVKLAAAVNEMDFNIMTAILQAHWDYSYHFNRNSDKEKDEILGASAAVKTASNDQYMVELVYNDIQYSDIVVKDGVVSYANAPSITVEGETVYFDRLKIMIGNTNGNVGTIELYPYISGRTVNTSTDVNWSAVLYKVTGITVRADTTKAYAALKALAEELA